MKDNYIEEERYLQAQKRVKKIKGFYWHLFWYLVVNIFLLVRIFSKLNTGDEFFKFEYFTTAIFWGIGLTAHWVSVFGKNVIFSRDWEERKIKEMMDKDKYDL